MVTDALNFSFTPSFPVVWGAHTQLTGKLHLMSHNDHPVVDNPTTPPATDTGNKPLERLVSLGGGHGLFATLRAGRTIADHVTAVVTVADDGGSSGRMRRELDCLPPGDLRMALAALTQDSDKGRFWEEVIQHRFGGNGALNGHAIGNFLITGISQVLGDDIAALDTLAKMLGVKGRVLPMSTVPLDLEADVLGLAKDPRESVQVRGQVAVATTIGEVRRVRVHPANPPAAAPAVAAIKDADLITLGPGSWFSSVIPHLLVPGIVEALNESPAPTVVVLNLVAEAGETSGFSQEHHVHMLHQHARDLNVDYMLIDQSTMPGGTMGTHIERAAASMGAELICADVREDDNRGRWTDRHKPKKLAAALADIAAKHRAR